MKIARSTLKSLIKEEMNRINEAPSAGTSVQAAEDSDESGDSEQATANPAGQERTAMVYLDKMEESDFAAAAEIMIVHSITKAAIPEAAPGKPWGANNGGGNPWHRALKYIAIANVKGPAAEKRSARLEVTFVVKPSPDGGILSIASIETSGDSRKGSPEHLQNMADELMNSINAANLRARRKLWSGKDIIYTVTEDTDFEIIIPYNLIT
jgi:hypothetical protein